MGQTVYVCVKRGCHEQAVDGVSLCPFHVAEKKKESKADMEQREKEIAESLARAKTSKHKDHDVIKSPNHYKGRTGMEAKEVIWEFDLGFCLGNAFKYIVRAGKKNPATLREDLMKARENINMRLEELDAEERLEATEGVPVLGINGPVTVVDESTIKAVDWKHTKP